MSGTKIFCPSCEKYTICESLPFNESPAFRSRPPRKFFGESQVFLRYRFCNTCKKSFISAEIPLESVERADQLIKEINKLCKDYFKAQE